MSAWKQERSGENEASINLSWIEIWETKTIRNFLTYVYPFFMQFTGFFLLSTSARLCYGLGELFKSN